ncbi:DUF4358 domain-containing protein [Cohnella cholangitidis]|uniref:DUF4358 domain-containing protein n=1 Tax=Cohnella cholangitidis TaxID=2598458 RepID=A0A7G5BWX3_9BACL|nr:DUF4358 domain-containing protein [Cohnella cholangitidis]QMV41457.1 DUF4358 domain-containing protein [Cohnella cholangitidis]
MKKTSIFLLLTVVLSLVLSACSSNNKEAAIDPKVPAKEMADQLLARFEQPMLMELETAMVQQLYRLDPALLEDYSIRTPLMNVKTNELTILKVKEAKDVAVVEAAVKQRAGDVQKQFESYLPDQYELSKNYKLVIKGNYILFVISENADELVKSFEGFFGQK